MTGSRTRDGNGTWTRPRTMTRDLSRKPKQELEPGVNRNPDPQTLGNTWLTNDTPCGAVKAAETLGAKLGSLNATRGWQTVFTVAGLVPDQLSQNRPPARSEESSGG